MRPDHVSVQVPGGRRVDLTSLPRASADLGLSPRSLRKAVRQGRLLGAMVRGRPYVEVGVEAHDLAGAVHAWKERSWGGRNPHWGRKRPIRKERKGIARTILAAMLARGRSR